MSTTTDLKAKLMLQRATRAGATRLAARVWQQVELLRKMRVWLPCEESLRYMSQAIWSNTGYDACMNYESAEEFAPDLREDLDAGWPAREVVDGVEHYVIRPFFARVEYMHEAGLGYLHTSDREDIRALDVAPRERPSTDPITGVYDEELADLITMSTASTLAIVNALRHLSTALAYPTLALSRVDGIRREVAVKIEDGTTELLAQLVDAVALPGVEAPPRHFGSDWDRTGRVRVLALDSTLATYLRDC